MLGFSWQPWASLVAIFAEGPEFYDNVFRPASGVIAQPTLVYSIALSAFVAQLGALLVGLVRVMPT